MHRSPEAIVLCAGVHLKVAAGMPAAKSEAYPEGCLTG